MFSVLDDKQRKRLAEPYKYSCQNSTLLDPVFQVFWRWLSEKLPIWVAPSALTYAGIALNIVTTLVLMYHCPRAEGQAPAWTFLMAAGALFIYQTSDALDGKQCYRLGFKHQALEEFTDHSCDAISSILLSLQACAAVGFGRDPIWMLCFCFFGTILFYCTHLQIYTSGIVKFGTFDVTEIQVCAMAILVLRSVYDVTLWDTQLPFLGIDLKQALILPQVFGMCKLIGQIYTSGRQRGGYTADGTSIMSALVPGAQVILVTILVAVASPGRVALKHPVLFVLAFGLCMAKVTSNLIVATVCKSPVELTDVCVIGGVLQLANILLGMLVDEYMLLLATILHVTIDLAIFHVSVVTEFCDCLGIKCFLVEPQRATLVKDGTLIQKTSATVQNGGLLQEKAAVFQNGQEWRARTKKINGTVEGKP